MATAELAAPSVVGTHADAAAEATPSSRGKNQHPDDFESAEEFLRYIRTEYGKDLEYDQKNRDESKLDAQFLAGEQWEHPVRSRREAALKPTLTINRLPAYVAQLVGNRRLSDVGVKVIPDAGGERRIAEVREGLIRSIQKNSRAQYAYDKAYEQQVVGGIGQFQVHLDYAHDDVFEQDIRIAAIPDPLAVVWDRTSVEPSGSDARHVFVIDRIPRAVFTKRYPKATAGDFDTVTREARALGWDTADSVQVVSFWRMRWHTRTVALMQSGEVHDVTEIPNELWESQVMYNRDGLPMIREVQRRYAQMYLCSSSDILAGPYDLPIQRLPVFRVPGWEVFTGEERKRWGLVRFLRDPQKLHNYWRSVIAEKLVGSPKAKWIAPHSAVEGREQQWRNSHLSDDPLLVYNAEAGIAPQRAGPIDVEPGLIEQSHLAAQDMRDVSNIHEASLGIQGNEVSGRAIQARQRVGELGTVIYQDNLNTAIEEAGKVINQLIPFVYDTPRVVKVLGADMLTEEQVPINGISPESVDITLGKYHVSIVTGPSYVTRRVESREEMMAMVNAMPQTMAVAADRIVEAQDWPEADEIARRLRTQLPPGLLSPEDMTPEQVQQMQAQAEAQAQQAQLAMAATQLELADKEVEIRLKAAKAQQAEAAAIEAMARAEQARALALKAVAEIEQGNTKTAIALVSALQTAENGASSNV